MSGYGRSPSGDGDERQPLLDGEEGQDSQQDRRPLHARVGASLSRAVARLSEPQKLNATEKLLLAATVLLLLLTAIFVGLFAGAQGRLNGGQGDHTPVPGNPQRGHHDSSRDCTTKECVLAAASVLQSIDEEVKPCDDFYHFAAGGWLKALDHQIPEDAGLFGSGQYVAARNAQLIREILGKVQVDAGESNTSSADDDNDEEAIDRRNLLKLKTFYDSCMDTATQDKLGSKPLMHMIGQIHSLFRKSSLDAENVDHEQPQFLVQRASHTGPLPRPPGSPTPLPPWKAPGRLPDPDDVTAPKSPRSMALTRVVSWMHAHGIAPIFGIMVDGDPVRDPTEGTVYLEPDGLGLPDKEYYEDKDELHFYNKVVLEGLRAVEHEAKVAAAGKHKKGEKRLRALARQVVELEREMARATPDGDVLADPVATYNPVAVDKLRDYFEAFDWPQYLSGVTSHVPHNVLVASPKYFRRLSEILSRTQDEVLEAYLVWTTVRTYGTDLGANASLRAPAEALERRAKGVDVDAREDRGTVCLNSLNDALGFLAGRYYVREAFPPSARSKASSIIDSIIIAFKQRLPELDWIDPKTRRAAEVKADNVHIKVGWPESPNTTVAADLENYYHDVRVKAGDYFGNQVRSTAAANKRVLGQAGQTLDVLRWDMVAQEVNAYYNPQGNEIVFPAGILQPPYFEATWPDYLQYGAFGTVSGHELSHAFDPTGRLYDENGFLRDWWTNDTAREFMQRQNCLEYQYGNYSLDDGTGRQLPLNPKLTIGEDVADAGGMAQSYRAWLNFLNEDTEESRLRNQLLPGLSQKYTREQLFFIAYGIAYARNLRPAEALRRIRTDPHSPNPYRVNGVLTNFEPFYEAFGCKAGDAMFTAEEARCHIW